MADSSNPLIALSDHTAQIVERAAQGVVAVHGGGRSSGIHWRSGVIVTAEEVLERDEDISVTLPGGPQGAAPVGPTSAGWRLRRTDGGRRKPRGRRLCAGATSGSRSPATTARRSPVS